MKSIITPLLYLATVLLISCNRNHGSQSENHVPVLVLDAASASIKPDSPVVIQGATFGGSRHEVVISFIDQKEYDPKDLSVIVQFFIRSPSGMVPMTQAAKSDMTSWSADVAKNQTHQLRILGVGDFDRMTVDVDISTSENTMETANEGYPASKSFDVVQAK